MTWEAGPVGGVDVIQAEVAALDCAVPRYHQGKAGFGEDDQKRATPDDRSGQPAQVQRSGSWRR